MIIRSLFLIGLLVVVSAVPAAETREELLRTVEVEPENSEARDRLADLYVKQADGEYAKGKKKTAFESYKKAIKVSPNHPRASARYWELKGETLSDTGKSVAAGKKPGQRNGAGSSTQRPARTSTSAAPYSGLSERDRKNMERLLALEKRVFEKLEGFQKSAEESVRLQGEMRESLKQRQAGGDSSAIYVLGAITMTVILAAFGFAFFVSREKKIENPFLLPAPQTLALPAPDSGDRSLMAPGAKVPLLSLPVDLRKMLVETAEAQWLAGNFSDSTFGQIANQLSEDAEKSIAQKARSLLETHFSDKAARDFVRKKSPTNGGPAEEDMAFLDVLPMETFRLIGNLIDVKTQRPGHNEAVAQLSVLMAEKLAMTSEQVELIRAGAYIHDMGMLEFEEDFFTRTEIFTHADLDYLREHPAKGVTMLTMENLPQKVRDIVRHHHERVDGSGYPDSLKSVEIPLEAQVVGCAECFIAMTTYRKYKRTVDAGAALHILRNSPGNLFDSDVIGALDSLVREKKISGAAPAARKALAGIISTPG